jgi:hypothetical protein
VGGHPHQRRWSQGVNLGVELCRLVDHGKLHMRHGLSAWVNQCVLDNCSSSQNIAKLDMCRKA